MSAPEPPAGGGDGQVIRPVETRAFAGQVDALEQGVTEAHEALRRLAAETLPVGSGADNAAIAAWYRDLVETDTVPAARALAGELDGVRRPVRESVAAWERADADVRSTYRVDPGTG
jgi:hypothetical protein